MLRYYCRCLFSLIRSRQRPFRLSCHWYLRFFTVQINHGTIIRQSSWLAETTKKVSSLDPHPSSWDILACHLGRKCFLLPFGAITSNFLCVCFNALGMVYLCTLRTSPRISIATMGNSGMSLADYIVGAHHYVVPLDKLELGHL